jgi:hypothetical protein
MARKSKTSDLLETAALAVAAVLFDPTAVPAILEYKPSGQTEAWRVEKFPAFVTEFNFGAHATRANGWPAAMTMFHIVHTADAPAGAGRIAPVRKSIV